MPWPLTPPPKEESSLTVQDLKEYTEVIRSVRKRHMPVVALLAEERAGKCWDGKMKWRNCQIFEVSTFNFPSQDLLMFLRCWLMGRNYVLKQFLLRVCCCLMFFCGVYLFLGVHWDYGSWQLVFFLNGKGGAEDDLKRSMDGRGWFSARISAEFMHFIRLSWHFPFRLFWGPGQTPFWSPEFPRKCEGLKGRICLTLNPRCMFDISAITDVSEIPCPFWYIHILVI